MKFLQEVFAPGRHYATPSPMSSPANHLQAVLENGLVGPLLRIICQLLFLDLGVCASVCAQKGVGRRFSRLQFRIEGVVCVCVCVHASPLPPSLPPPPSLCLGGASAGTWR